MKLHLNLSLRRALLAAMAAVASLATTTEAGIVDTRYDLQYYLDFSRNAGAFTAGATNVEVGYSDGSAAYTIPLMPYLGSFAQVSDRNALNNAFQPVVTTNGGAALVSAQFVYGAAHVYNEVYHLYEQDRMRYTFHDENANPSTADIYSVTNIDTFGHDGAITRTDKLVTAVAYTPMATDEFMRTLSPSTWLYRLGNGGYWDSTGSQIATGSNALGGVINMDSYSLKTNGDWYMYGTFNKGEKLPLNLGVFKGDSGSPLFAWDAENEQFLFVGSLWASNCHKGFGNDVYARYNPTLAQEAMAKYTVNAAFSGTDTIAWSASDAATGEGTLTQGSTVINYTGKGSANAMADTKGLSFATDSEQLQVIQLQGNVNMGAGALTFTNGDWVITEGSQEAEDDTDHTLSSAGFEVLNGASLTLELTGTASEEIRKVGEGTMTIAGSGNNDASLVVGGGTIVYDVEYEDGKIVGCTLGNAGETRLNRQKDEQGNGYAASSVRLEGGVAIIVLMDNGQFKTNSVAGDTFTFGNDGGLLNLNGRDLTWGVINQDGSGKGARIGNKTPLGETTPGLSTFTYTGTGTFAGCFVDEGDGKAELAVVYEGAANDAWKLTGNNTNEGGFTVQSGTLVLEGIKTHHVWKSDANDWTFASIEGSDVTVKNGASFQLSHHAQLVGDVIVENGGKFIMNQTVNAASESVSGSVRQDMAALGITSLKGNVYLDGGASMVVNTESPVVTTMKGNIINDIGTNINNPQLASFTKKGGGVFVVDGQLQVARGTIEAGGLVVKDKEGFVNSYYSKWSVLEKGFIAIEGLENQTALACISAGSSGVLALTSDQETELELYKDYGEWVEDRTSLYIGAWGENAIHYGTSSETLTAYNNKWLLGGGTGTLIVDFLLTGDHDLIVGNEWSSGTVHLTNTLNDIKDIYIKGTGNKLTYEEGALGGATISLTYGNALGLYDASLLDVVNTNSSGVLALASSANLNLAGRTLAIGALNDLTYQDKISLGEGEFYRFGGSGNLTVDTELNASNKMQIDGQGTTGSSVTLARENAFAGDIIVGGGLELATPNSQGNIALHAGHSNSLAVANSIDLRKGANFYTDGQNLIVQNLSAQSGSTISNNGDSNSSLVLYVTEGVNSSIADGVLNDNYNTAGLGIIKAGKGTVIMGANMSWSGGITIMEGKVEASIASGGIGADGAFIYVNKGASLHLTSSATNDCKEFGITCLKQTLAGDGEVSISNGNDMLFLKQAAGFEGQVKVTGNTRLYVTDNAVLESGTSVSTSQAFDKATIVVESGSQVRLTPSIYQASTGVVNSWADYVIAGDDFKGSSSGLVQSGHDGALVIDHLSTVWGNVTLADHAMIASWSTSPTSSDKLSGWPYQCLPTWQNQTFGGHYGVINRLGGIIRGQILGEDKILTIGGNESMTITADSANTYGDLIIANGNGNNDDKFALRLDGGKAVSQTSTALGKGNVTLGDGLILRLAGTGTANQTEVVYTYANNIAAGNNSTIQSYNITNKLTGTVSMAEGANKTLNLATAQGGVLHLAGGVSGSGTLNIGANSKVVLGDGVSSTVTFGGNVVAGAGADLTLESPAAVATTTTISGTDSLTLNLGGTADFTLGGIKLGTSEGVSSSALKLSFDFTNATVLDYSTLTIGNITAGSTLIDLQLNLLGDLENGTYVLIDGTGETLSTSFGLSDNLGGRLSLSSSNGQVILTVGNDSRFFWSSADNNGLWNITDANWKKAGIEGTVVYTDDSDVLLNASGLSTADTREVITVSDSISAGKISVSSLYELSGSGSLRGSKLVVANGGDLNLGANSTFDDGVLVNDARLEVGAKTLTADVTAENNAQVALNGTTITGNISVGEASSVTMDNTTLSGLINLSDAGTIITQEKSITEGDSTARLSGTFNADGSGSLSLIDGHVTIDGKVALDTLSVAESKRVTLWNANENSGAEKSFGTLELGNTATLTVYNAVTNKTSESASIGSLTLAGSTATIEEIQGSGYMKIGSLNMAAGVTSATLTLEKAANPAAPIQTTIFELGADSASAGNFAGTVDLRQRYNHGGAEGHKHSVFINLSGSDTLSNAVVQMIHQPATKGILGLGINVGGEGGSATIAGLVSSKDLGNRVLVFSGYAQQDASWYSDEGFDKNAGEVARTLYINTADNASHDFYGQVREQLSLVKQGGGKQAFLGESSAFNGNITIEAGTLAFNAAGASLLSGATDVLVKNGATLDLSAIDYTAGTGTISIEASQSVAFESGATLALGNLEQNHTYSIFQTHGELIGWNSDVLSAENVTINGYRLSETYREGAVNLLYGVDGSFSYTIESATLTWLGGNGNWDTSSSNWDMTPDVAGDSTKFYQKDNVVFNDKSETTVTLGQDIVAGSVSILDGNKHTFRGGGYALTVDSFASAGAVHLGADGYATTLTINESSDIDGILDLHWDNVAVNLKGSHHEIEKVMLRGNGDRRSRLNVNAQSADIKTIEVLNNSHLTFGLAAGENSANYKVDNLTVTNNYSHISRTITVDAGVVLGVESMNVYAGHAVVVDGELNINSLSYNYGADKNTVSAEHHKTTWSGSGVTTISGTTSMSNGLLTVQGGELNFNGATTLMSLSVTGGTVNFANTVTVSSLAFSGGVTLGVNGTSLTLADGVTLAEGSRVLTSASGSSTTINPSHGGVLDDRNSYYSVTGVLNIGDDDATNGGTVYVKGLALSHTNAASTLNVKSGNTLVITGSNRTTSGNPSLSQYGDFQLTRHTNATYNIDGVFTSNAIFSISGGAATLNVRSGGEFNLLRGASDIGSSSAITVNVADGGRLNVAGYDRDVVGDNHAVFNLAAGATLGAIEDKNKGAYTIVRNAINLGTEGVSGAVKIDTDLSAADSTYVVTEKDAGAQFVLEGTINSKANTKVSVTGQGTAHVAGSASISGGVEVESGAALAISAVTVKATPKESTVSKIASMTSADGTAAAKVDGSVSLSHSGTTAIIEGSGDSPSVMSNALISIAQGASLRVEDMLITGGSRITGVEAVSYTTDAVSSPSVTLVDATVVLGGGNATVGSQHPLAVDMTLQAMGGGTLEVMAGASVLTVDSTALSNLLVTSGSNFVVDFGSLLAGTSLTNVDFLCLNFEGVTYEQPTNTSMVGVVNGQEYEAYYAQSANTGWVGGVYFDVRMVPEPTTSTLSLLALAGLCARRRRKD